MDEQDEIKKIDNLILKYLEREISNEEKIELYRWVELSESNKLHFKEMQELWLSTEAILAPEDDTQEALQQFRAKIKNYKQKGSMSCLKILTASKIAWRKILLYAYILLSL